MKNSCESSCGNNNAVGRLHFSHQACGLVMEIKANPILSTNAALRSLIKIRNYLKRKKRGKKAFDYKNMFPTVGNCFVFSQTIKDKNETPNCSLGRSTALLANDFTSVSYP